MNEEPVGRLVMVESRRLSLWFERQLGIVFCLSDDSIVIEQRLVDCDVSVNSVRLCFACLALRIWAVSCEFAM